MHSCSETLIFCHMTFGTYLNFEKKAVSDTVSSHCISVLYSLKNCSTASGDAVLQLNAHHWSGMVIKQRFINEQGGCAHE